MPFSISILLKVYHLRVGNRVNCLSSISNLGHMKEIGVQFTGSSNSSGQTAVYVDHVAIQ